VTIYGKFQAAKERSVNRWWRCMLCWRAATNISNDMKWNDNNDSSYALILINI